MVDGIRRAHADAEAQAQGDCAALCSRDCSVLPRGNYVPSVGSSIQTCRRGSSEEASATERSGGYCCFVVVGCAAGAAVCQRQHIQTDVGDAAITGAGPEGNPG